MDDRDERPGIKFKDADLIGIPLRITLGQRTLDAGKVEIRNRKTGKVDLVNVEETIGYVNDHFSGKDKLL
jgi:prolyl-tRNA synthetase